MVCHICFLYGCGLVAVVLSLLERKISLTNGCAKPCLLCCLVPPQEFGCRATELRLVGGGSKNDLWCQIIADVFQIPVRRPVEGAEAAALGAALQAAAVFHREDVGKYVEAHEPKMEEKVRKAM